MPRRPRIKLAGIQMLRFTLLMVGVMVSSTSTAGGAARCPADIMPIQIVDDTWIGPKTTFSAAGVSALDPDFGAFITAVTNHIETRLVKNKLCIANADGKEHSLLQFINWPLANGRNKPSPPLPSLDARQPGGCRIISPWIDLSIERKPTPRIIGVIRWNERQLLADQAVLAKARNVPPGVVMPLGSDEFTKFALDYADSEILREPAPKPVEERVPADLLWLFRRSVQTTLIPFFGSARHAMNTGMKKGAKGYTKLVNALIDHCLASDGTDIHYISILDAADLIPLEQYKIDTLLD